ncbi:glycosyltransferase family 4 protein, partial [Ochrovirga pacifica]|uniref:glycosyltransferase family 4 protein n=1 Tax=Ochrovirga pacifica TaxID=1042376 RepID=UPI0002557BE5
MKLLTIGDYDGNLSLYEAQLKQFILMHQRGINVTIMGKFSDEIATLLANKNVPFVINKAHQKKDITFIKQLQSYVEENKIDIIHVFGGNNTSNTCIAFKKNKKVKIIGYMGSTSIHWHDPSAYKTYLNPRIDAIICNSKDNARHFKKQLFFNKNKVYSIYKGYDVSWFDGVLPADL